MHMLTIILSVVTVPPVTVPAWAWGAAGLGFVAGLVVAVGKLRRRG